MLARTGWNAATRALFDQRLKALQKATKEAAGAATKSLDSSAAQAFSGKASPSPYERDRHQSQSQTTSFGEQQVRQLPLGYVGGSRLNTLAVGALKKRIALKLKAGASTSSLLKEAGNDAALLAAVCAQSEGDNEGSDQQERRQQELFALWKNAQKTAVDETSSVGDASQRLKQSEQVGSFFYRHLSSNSSILGMLHHLLELLGEPRVAEGVTLLYVELSRRIGQRGSGNMHTAEQQHQDLMALKRVQYLSSGLKECEDFLGSSYIGEDAPSAVQLMLTLLELMDRGLDKNTIYQLQRWVSKGKELPSEQLASFNRVIGLHAGLSWVLWPNEEKRHEDIALLRTVMGDETAGYRRNILPSPSGMAREAV